MRTTARPLNFRLASRARNRENRVMSGIFTSQPYASQDWNPNRNSRKIYYMDMKPNFIVNPEVQAIITTEQLQDAIPDFEWRKGHSGQLLNSEQAKKPARMWNQARSEQCQGVALQTLESSLFRHLRSKTRQCKDNACVVRSQRPR